MEKFRTSLQIRPSPTRISLNDRILTIGSCFSDSIGAQLVNNKIGCMVNPFGALYNPVSIHHVIHYAIGDQHIPEDTYVQRDDIFLNYNFHSDFSAMKISDLQEKVSEAVIASNKYLKDCRWLMITFGTVWVYELKSTGHIVANCHKMPSGLFEKKMLTQKNLIDSFEKMYTDLKKCNPDINIVLTVSPVRHLKETLELNSVSKSILRVSCHTLSEQYHDVHYFPAYEIMIDDLRDYRFYKSDMLHPTGDAEDYIWTKFAEQFFDDRLKVFLSAWKEVRYALAHRPFHPSSTQHQNFITNTIQKLEKLKHLVNVDKEIAELRDQLL